MFLEFEELSKLLSNVPKRDVFLEFEELRGVGYVYLDGCLSVYFPLYFTRLTCYFNQYQVPYYFNQYQVPYWCLFLMIVFHHQTKTPIDFLCRQ